VAKPKEEDLRDWCLAWEQTDHTGKLELCEKYNITYETGRHWYSDAPAEYKQAVPPMQMSMDDLLTMRPGVNLDFVTFDIETSNLTADFSMLLSACIKPFGMLPIVFRADHYPTWNTNRADDRQIVIDIAEELQKHAIIITHYGDRFDIPYMRAKMVRWGLPPLPSMFGVDSWKIAKANFQVSSRRLKNLAQFFQVGEKEGVEGGLWMEAAYNGSKEAMDEIVEHNVQDCRILEKLAALTFPYLKSVKKL
jgi:uncharacterized protein YprB with RNaseH-like and TPR domain